VVYLLTLVWSAIDPKDGFTWWLEVAPALIGGAILVSTFNSFRLSPLLYALILLHCIVLMVGAHYTYAEVPLFDSLQQWAGFERNNYDKLGHFMQGLVPAMLAREILIRKQVVNGSGWRNLFMVSVSLAFSALYELIEWWVALASGENAEAFLGTQGYVWDTQSDMGMALLGALVAVMFLGRLHDRQLEHV
jgi:putative membrane protein